VTIYLTVLLWGDFLIFQELQAMDLILSEDPSTEEPHVQLDAPMLGDGNMVDVSIIEVFLCSSFAFQSLGQFFFP
jgi:hypothetical protein